MDNVKKKPEVFIALIAPIGVNLELIQSELSNALKSVAYIPSIIKLTSFLTEHPEWFNLEHDTPFQRYERYIAAGNQLCRDAGRRDALILSAIGQIWRDNPNRPNEISFSTAFVFSQLKREEEVATLREIYGKDVIFLGCYAPRKARIKSLVSTLLKDQRGTDQSRLEADALTMIGIDENQKDEPDGQRFLDTYPHSDFIIDCTSPNTIKQSLDRFVRCFFGDPFVSPTRDEHGMHLAYSASLRSTDLSRQVGASIFGPNKEVISLGCNEVPAFGGGTYWPDNVRDSRDFQIGYDSNARLRDDMIRDLLVRLRNRGWLAADYAGLTSDTLSERALHDGRDSQGPLAKAMISDIIEYGRIVHAEMNALSDAARFGRATMGATLYCTTMPCHLCTKLIIASGIHEVQYLQPYYKSLVRELYEDSVSIDEETSERVAFKPFRGVTPNGFRTVFSKGRRKDAADKAVKWRPIDGFPVNTSDIPGYLTLENNVALNSLEKAVARINQIHNPLKL